VVLYLGLESQHDLISLISDRICDDITNSTRDFRYYSSMLDYTLDDHPQNTSRRK